MGFRVVDPNPQVVWVPVDNADTLYEGQIVTAGGDGMLPITAASGAADTSGKLVPMGIVIGGNDKNPVFNSTYKGLSIAQATAQAAQLARDWFGVEGMFPKGDPQAFARVALIGPNTLIEGPIFNAAYGTALTAYAETTGSVDGATVTTAAIGFTPVADLVTIYCRTGANMGLYRITKDTSTTVHEMDVVFPYDVAIGDTFILAPMRFFGPSYVQFDGESTYIEGGSSASLATNYYILDIIRLDLRESGKERAVFRFNMDHFCKARA
jgi:hypothetical protein